VKDVRQGSGHLGVYHGTNTKMEGIELTAYQVLSDELSTNSTFVQRFELQNKLTAQRRSVTLQGGNAG
jgi:hypothetical protein